MSAPDWLAVAGDICRPPSAAEVEAMAWAHSVDEALLYVRLALPADPDADWLTPDQARLVALEHEVTRLQQEVGA
jgi:hypothetical protein